ncbi:MAG: Hsp33 family molecular chaperone HslO [Clostridia bacterium]|nr:Hsp33 family molecular chaperone HslO [Clostridia bacterium]
MKDELLKIGLLDGQARATIAITTNLTDEARRIHSLSRVATAALGRMLTATVIISSDLKSDKDSVTCMIKGSGPLGTVLAVGDAKPSVKGYVGNPAVDLPRVNGKLPVGDAVGRDGTLTVIKDLGLKQPYSGRVNLVSGEIAEDFCQYFMVSEQTPSIVSLGVLTADKVKSAGGIVVQAMPNATDEAIRELELSSALFANISSIISECSADDMIRLMLGHLRPQTLERRAPKYECDCCVNRVQRAIISLGEDELLDMISSLESGENGDSIEVNCQFCDKKYNFTARDLQEILHDAKQER